MRSSLFSSLSSDRKRFLKVMVLISATIRKTRKSMNLSQKEFAELMNVTQAMVSKWESGHYNFSMETVVRIYDKLHLPLNFEPLEESNPMHKYLISPNLQAYTQLADGYAA